LRVLQINDALNGGGAEVVFRETCRVLKDRAVDVRTFYAKPSVKVEVGDLADYIFSFKYHFALKKVIDDFKPEIIHIHGFHHYLSPSILYTVNRFKKKYNYPVIMTVHNYHFMCANNGYLRWKKGKPIVCEACNTKKYYRILLKQCDERSFFINILKFLQHYVCYSILKLERNIDHYLCPSDFIKGKLKTIVDENKIQILRNCVFHSRKFIEEINNLSAKIKFTFDSIIVGRLSPEKGVLYFFENDYSFEKFGDILIIGDDVLGLKKEIKKLLKIKNFNNHVYILPSLSHIKVLSYMNKAKTVVFPPINYENSPLVIFEAKILGKNIFHYNMDSVKEIEALPDEELFEDKYTDNLLTFYKKILKEKQHAKNYQ
jgi:glycosyltransferase involved in cell wall biosynthesis